MSALLAVALKGLVVLAAAGLGARLLRGASASTRHGVWVVAFAALALLPVLEVAGPRWSVGVLPPAEAVPFGPAIAPPLPPPAPPAPPAPPPPPPPVFGSESSAYSQVAFESQMQAFDRSMEAREMDAFDDQVQAFGAWPDESEMLARPASGGVVSRLTRAASRSGQWLLALWAAGALAVSLGWLAALAAARRIVAQATPETDEEWAVLAERARRLVGLPAPVRLLRTDALDVPVAWGWGHGAVVLPAGADDWDEDRREAVLLHEMAHLVRRDAWSQGVAQAALAVHWANPLAWWGYRRFLDAREQACDDAVIRSGARPSAYAAHLVGVARAVRRDRLALAAVAPMARTSPIEERVVSILDAGRVRGVIGRTGAAALVVLSAGVLVPLAALQPVAQTPRVSPTSLAFADTLDPERRLESALDADLWAEVDEATDEAAGQLEGALDVELAETLDDASDDDWEDLDDTDEIDAEIDAAQADIRRAIQDLEQRGGPEAQLRIQALRGAEQGLAEIDRAAIREHARAQALRALGADRQPERREPPHTVSPPAPPLPPTPPAVDWNAVDRARAAAVARSSSPS